MERKLLEQTILNKEKVWRKSHLTNLKSRTKAIMAFAMVLLFGTMSYTTNAQCTGLVAPFTESFDASSTPTCWSQSATTGGPWAFSTGSGVNTSGCSGPSDHTGNSGYFAWMDQSSTDAGVILEMGAVNITALTTPYLEFFYWMCGTGYTPPNELYIEALLDN